MKAHCLFEQSGTFKNEFRKLGVEAYDYDIKNDFGQTDYQVDLFQEIRGGYAGDSSIFDNFSTDDVILAFFPCTRFENQIMLSFRGQANQFKGWDMETKIRYDMGLMDELHRNYSLVCQMFLMCIDRGLKLIMENPYSEEHFLRRYWCVSPQLIDKDRRESGDYFAKPTQYWFVNCEPKNNLILEPMNLNYIGAGWKDKKREDWLKTGAKTRQIARSMIHPDYANRFIRQYILEGEPK